MANLERWQRTAAIWKFTTRPPLTGMSFSLYVVCSLLLRAGRERAAAVFNSLLTSAATLSKGEPRGCSSGLK